MQYDHSPWPVKDVSLGTGIQGLFANSWQIVYTAIVGTVMLGAFLEWFLWLAAFMYCLVKVYQKAEHWSVKMLALVIGTVFTALRYGCTYLSSLRD